MPRGVFVTGTDTGVGKTVVSAALMHHGRRDGPVRYWKPVQTGAEEDDDTAVVRELAACRADELFTQGVRLPRPVSPHLAARLNGTTIDVEPLVASMPQTADERWWIVEGAGGVLVPLNPTETMADLMVRLGWPVVVAARSALGTINHTLLTIDALRRRGLRVAGVVMVGDRNDDNREAIEEYGAVAVLGQMPWFAPLTPAALEAWALSDLDRGGRMLREQR